MTINETLINALTTKFKKDAPEVFKRVAQLGYVTYKYDGTFGIENKKLNKRVRIAMRTRYRYVPAEYKHRYIDMYTVYGDGLFKGEYTYDELKKFDFVGYLNKPNNKAWTELKWANHDIYSNKPTLAKYRRLCDARSWVKYKNDEAERIKKEIEKAQKQLLDAVRQQVNYEHRLDDLRKELGLKRR